MPTSIAEADFGAQLRERFPGLSAELEEFAGVLKIEMAALRRRANRCIEAADWDELQRVYGFLASLLSDRAHLSPEMLREVEENFLDRLVIRDDEVGIEARTRLPPPLRGMWEGRMVLREEFPAPRKARLAPTGEIQGPAWRDYARRIGAQLIEETSTSIFTFGVDHSLVIPLDRWRARLTYTPESQIDPEYETTWMRATYRAATPLDFRVERAHRVSRRGRGGMKDTGPSGDPEFDRLFLVQGAPRELLTRLLSSADFRRCATRCFARSSPSGWGTLLGQRLLPYQRQWVYLKSRSGGDRGELTLEYDGAMPTSDSLVEAGQLLLATLHQLVRIGVAF